MKVLLFDSGFGLLPFYFALQKEQIPNEYYIEMEEEFFPLGNKKEKELLAYAKRKFDSWQAKKIDHVFIICNTFSCLLQKMNLSPYTFQIHTILTYTKKYLSTYSCTLFATQHTCRILKPKHKIKGSDFVEWIEKEDLTSIIKRIKKWKISTPYLLIGCTHFSFLSSIILVYHPQIKILDPYLLLLKEMPRGDTLSYHYNKKAKDVIKKWKI